MTSMQPQKTKSFLQRPEGNLGLFVIFGGLVIGGIVLFNFLPVIIILLQNTLHALFLGGAVLGIVALGMNNKFRTLISYGFKSSMRAATGWFITIDPIGILKNYVEDMDKKIQQVSANITNLKGQVGTLERSIQSKRQDMENSLQIASKAKSTQGKEMKAVLEAKKAGRAKGSMERLDKVFRKMELTYRVLSNMREKLIFLREDTADEVSTQEIEYKAVLAAHKAMSLAQKLISGSTSEKALFEQTMQYIADDIGFKMGEMEEFMELSEGFMSGVDLQQEIFNDKGMALLDKWEKGESLLLGDSKDQIIKDSETATKFDANVIKVSNPTAGKPNTQFSNYFNK